MKTDNSSSDREEQLKYLGTTVTYQSSIQEEIKSRFKSRNVCHHSVQNLLSYCLISKNIKIKIHRTVILRAAFYGSENWSLTLREERRLRGFENRVLRGIGIRGGEKTTYGGAL